MGMWSNPPAEMLLEILTRLPTESVLDCKLVCKPWRSLVSHHPSFSKLHLTHLNQSAAESGKLSFLVESQLNQFHYLEYNENNDDETPVHITRRININPPFECSFYKIMGSINGLVCLYRCRDDVHCICNPVTREYVMLPKIIRRDCNDRYRAGGFGYLPLTNEYKVVELYALREQVNVTKVAVYTLGSGNGWRNVGSLDSVILENGAGVFTGGALYWKEAFNFMKIQGKLFVFDLTDEKFGEHVLLPLSPTDTNVWYNYFIGVLGGVLYYAIRERSAITGCVSFNIWLLKKNVSLDIKEQVEDVPLTWSKEFSSLERKPLAITKNGCVLSHDDQSLGIYDPKASTSKKVVDFTAFRAIHTHQNTLVSLKELGEKDVEIMELAEETGSRGSKI